MISSQTYFAAITDSSKIHRALPPCANTSDTKRTQKTVIRSTWRQPGCRGGSGNYRKAKIERSRVCSIASAHGEGMARLGNRGCAKKDFFFDAAVARVGDYCETVIGGQSRG